MKISPARIAAFEILLKIGREKAFSSVLLPLFEKDLAASDRGLCHQLTLGILRKQLYLDKIIAEFTNGKKLDPAVKIALRIGLYQLLFLDKVPDYSAINESVNLVQYAKKTSAKGFVNAILRRATREAVSFNFAGETERISIETSHPAWLIEKWIASFGIEETEKLAAANNEIPPVAFRFTAKGSFKEAKNADRSEFVDGCFTAETIDAEMLDFAEKGEIYFQDEASQMVAAAIELKDGDKFLDVCAAPGSKATQIAERGMRNAELIVTGDLHYQRLQFMRGNCQKQGVDFVNVLQYDAVKSLPFADESFDIVLVDAPCSGTGTIRHNPEIRYFLDPADFAGLWQKQLAILQNASKLVKPGGRLIYSTCSLEKEENEEVCSAFLSGDPDFEKTQPKVPGKFLRGAGFAQTFPHRDNMDGFFIASFERV